MGGARNMEEKSTDDLSQELMSQPNLNAFIHENGRAFDKRNFTELLTALYDRKDISKAALARRAGISEVYLHQVFSGRRNPSRDRLICICTGLGASLEETQELLKHAGYAQLYPRLKRDAIISHGLVHGTPLSEINDMLFTENEKTLY